jgi:hypothetical protein
VAGVTAGASRRWCRCRGQRSGGRGKQGKGVEAGMNAGEGAAAVVAVAAASAPTTTNFFPPAPLSLQHPPTTACASSPLLCPTPRPTY